MIRSIVLYNTVTKKSLRVNDSLGEFWLAEADFGTVESNINTYKYLDQIGVSIYNTTLNPRQIAITGWVAGDDLAQVEKQRTELNSFVNPLQLTEARVGEYQISFMPRSSVKYSPVYRENNEVMCKFLITGYCPYPLFTTITEERVSVAYTERKFKFPLVIPKDTGIVLGVRQPSLIATVNNTGDVPVGYNIEFKTSGAVLNPRLIDIGTQQFILINKQLSAGESVIINTQEGKRKVTGVNNGVESNYFRYRSFDSSWLTLATGQNLLRYAADEGITSLEVVIDYNPGFLEVDK